MDAPLKGMTILLVEDAADTREVFGRLLEADGADVISAGSAREAAEIAATREFDVLLTDLGLPDIPGDALIGKILRECRRRPRVVAVTGFDEPYGTRALRAGADVVITKPVAWSRLLESLTASETAESPPDAAAASRATRIAA
jgi:CheY-like chemotaxis protein